jgi:hypothetical protein
MQPWVGNRPQPVRTQRCGDRLDSPVDRGDPKRYAHAHASIAAGVAPLVSRVTAPEHTPRWRCSLFPRLPRWR